MPVWALQLEVVTTIAKVPYKCSSFKAFGTKL